LTMCSEMIQVVEPECNSQFVLLIMKFLELLKDTCSGSIDTGYSEYRILRLKKNTKRKGIDSGYNPPY
jgi:hypothetical protein